jgi:hypothetical protein
VTPADIEELARLTSEATAGPWTVGEDGRGIWGVVDGVDRRLVDVRLVEGLADAREQNAALVAAVRNALRELLDLARIGLEAEAHVARGERCPACGRPTCAGEDFNGPCVADSDLECALGRLLAAQAALEIASALVPASGKGFV